MKAKDDEICDLTKFISDTRKEMDSEREDLLRQEEKVEHLRNLVANSRIKNAVVSRSVAYPLREHDKRSLLMKPIDEEFHNIEALEYEDESHEELKSIGNSCAISYHCRDCEQPGEDA